MDESTKREISNPLFAPALLLAIASGGVIAAGLVFDVPTTVGYFAMGCFGLAIALVAFLAARQSRKDGVPLPSALGQGLGSAFRWLLTFLP